jgi:membrane protease YdiL (CAAX protease family)
MVGRDMTRFWARFIVFIEGAVLFLFIALPSAFTRTSPVITVLAFVGAAVLVGGGVRMRSDPIDTPPPPPDAAATRFISWDWTDVLMFVPGAFTAASLLVSMLVPLIDAATGGSGSAVRSAVDAFVQQACFYGGAIFNVWVLVGLRRGGTLEQLGWRRFSWWWIPIAAVAALGTLYIADALQVAAQHLFPGAKNTQCQSVQQDYSHFIWLAVIVVCVMAPLAEETIFRGFIFGWMQHVMPVGFAVVASGAVFGAAHLVLLLFIPLWAVGIVLAVMYRSSNSLWPGATVHALFNLPGIIAILSASSC